MKQENIDRNSNVISSFIENCTYTQNGNWECSAVYLKILQHLLEN